MIDRRILLWPLLLLLGGCALRATPPAAHPDRPDEPETRTPAETAYSYTLDCRSPGAPLLAERFAKVSRLALMQDQPVGLTTLEQRLAVSLTEGRSLLRNQGYYEGSVSGRLERPEGRTVRAVVVFNPGPLYKFGRIQVTVSGPAPPAAGPAGPPPRTLAEVGLAPGSPATADDMLLAVDRLAEAWRNRGYPEAKVDRARYFANRAARELEAEITLLPGPFVRLGPVLAPGAPVDQAYLEALKTWQDGRPWSRDLLENYLTTLRRTGLFQTVEAAAEGEDEVRPIRLQLTKAPERTVGGQLSYDTDFGPGVNAYWEHRNLTGHGDRLRLDLPIWADLQELTATYRYPYLFRPDQDLIARGGLLHQNTDAYRLWSGSASAGLERRLSRYWRVTLSGYTEGGSLSDPNAPKSDFLFFGLPVTTAYDHTDSPLDPTRGARLTLATAPYTGAYHDRFNVFRARLEGQGFLPLGSPRAVLALRGLWGGLWGIDNSRNVPSSLRFYSGGGGSVRGYDYQSVGPRNNQNKPLGGLSQVEVGAETRLRFSETLGAVAFLDGGMVYADAADRLFQDLLWGAGLGFRYFTPIGPVRLDVAQPLDRRPGDSHRQLYLSLGQSF
ncbi:MAG: BamA/TamA family outer membrane protein [Candidatus Adiutrix sp.]|jgi:translocation and assembly module TamA|nr:BamA/TamA family outer membrane protein [Candidatus Adiutrix sp.]